jgi:hypothetical protein
MVIARQQKKSQSRIPFQSSIVKHNAQVKHFRPWAEAKLPNSTLNKSNPLMPVWNRP